MSPFDGLLNPPKVRPGDYIPSQEAVERDNRYRASGERRRTRADMPPPPPNPWGLTWQQAEVAKRLGIMTTAEIADDLDITTKTVSEVIRRCRDKMHAYGRKDIASMWRRHCGVEQ